jgi:hypothetical protein
MFPEASFPMGEAEMPRAAPSHPLLLFTQGECRAWIATLLALRSKPVRRSPVRFDEAGHDALLTSASAFADDVPVATLVRRRVRAFGADAERAAQRHDAPMAAT